MLFCASVVFFTVWFFLYSWVTAQKHTGRGVGEMRAVILVADKTALPDKNPNPKSIFLACCWCLGDLAHIEVSPDDCFCTTEELPDSGRRKVLLNPALPSDCVVCGCS